MNATRYYSFLTEPGNPETKTAGIIRYVPEGVSFQRWDGDGWVEDPTLIDYVPGDETRDVAEVDEAEAMALVAERG